MNRLWFFGIIFSLVGCAQTSNQVDLSSIQPDPVVEAIVSEDSDGTQEVIDTIKTSELIPAGPVEVLIYFSSETHASGVIDHNRSDLVEQINWWAYKSDVEWELLVNSADTSVTCAQLIDLDFPEMMLGNCQ